jgi:alpha-galactosidase
VFIQCWQTFIADSLFLKKHKRLERRNFIKITGASLSSLLLSNYIKAAGTATDTIQMPDTVKILSGTGYWEMQSSDKQNWIYRDITVKLKKNKDAVSVLIHSPTLPLKEVQLQWKYATSKDTKILGDAYERTYGDISFQPLSAGAVATNPTKKMPWYCVEHNGKQTTCFGVRTGCNAFCYWRVTDTVLELNLDTRNGGNGVFLGSRMLPAADIVTTKNTGKENVFATVRRFCRQMCDDPAKVKQPVYGINDWYVAYGNNSADLILKHTAMMSPLATNTSNRPFSVIDDGWSLGTDYTKTNEKFPDMPRLVSEIKNLGMHPGLWTRPLLPKPGQNRNMMIRRSQTGEGDSVLDPTIEENILYIQGLFKLYRQWGFELVKHDYSSFDIFKRWGMQMGDSMTDAGWQFNDNSKTNAEIILYLYRSMRAAAGDMYLIGCNTVSHLSAGIFELNRIGDDTSGKEWERTKKMGVNTMGFRMVQHDNFYQADGDCVGLTTAIPWEKNKQWMQLLAQSSAPLFISAQAEAVGTEQKDFIKKCFADAAQNQPIGEPLDWLDNPLPSKWKLDGNVVEFNW